VKEIPEDLKLIYRTAWELPMKALIEIAADRGAYIDQSASLNLFMESPTIGKLSSMYMYAWEKGIKTTYYLRSRPATSINKVTVAKSETDAPTPAPVSDMAAIACSLENPEACEACQ
jgi:ribonucleoside-diphosphate reductase alpha chain